MFYITTVTFIPVVALQECVKKALHVKLKRNSNCVHSSHSRLNKVSHTMTKKAIHHQFSKNIRQQHCTNALDKNATQKT